MKPWLTCSRSLEDRNLLIFATFRSCRKQDWASFITCRSNVICWSKMIPRFLAVGLMLVHNGPINWSTAVTNLSGPNKMISVLSGFKWRKLRDIQSLMAAKHSVDSGYWVLRKSRSVYHLHYSDMTCQGTGWTNDPEAACTWRIKLDQEPTPEGHHTAGERKRKHDY